MLSVDFTNAIERKKELKRSVQRLMLIAIMKAKSILFEILSQYTSGKTEFIIHGITTVFYMALFRWNKQVFLAIHSL